MVAIMIFAFLTGCTSQIIGVEKLRNYENTLQHNNETALKVENINGNVIIQADSNATVAAASAVLKVVAGSEEAAEEFLDKIDIHFAREGDAFVIESKVPKVWTMPGKAKKPKSWSVDYKITIPEGLDIETAMTNGNVEILGANVSVMGHSVNGNVTIRDNTGSINAIATNGNTEVSNDQDFEIKLTQISQNGSHTLNIPYAKYGNYNLRTTNGQITINMPSSVEPKIKAKLVNGNITMTMGERLSGLIDLKTTNGTASTNMVVNTTTVDGKTEKNHLKGMIGAGLGEINAETTNGSITMNVAGLPETDESEQ
jgi:DUF4097 and DUF4098 domain-containing protein YvlB